VTRDRACKSSIDAQPTLDARVKADLKTICDAAANGDAEAAADAAEEGLHDDHPVQRPGRRGP
jgi:hypothetical protein